MKRFLGFCCAAWLLAFAGVAQAATVHIEQAIATEDLIKVYASFAWDEGQNIESVDQKELGVSFDGVPAQLTSLARFSQTGEGMGITLLLDVSKSMGIRQGGGQTPFALLVEATKKLIASASPKDSFCIMTFGDDVKVVQPFTSDKNVLYNALSEISPSAQNTLLYESVQKALRINRQKGGNIPDRRAIIIISDGKDEGSGLTLDDVLKQDLQPSIPLFTVGYTRVEPEHLTALRRLSVMTGGLFFASPKAQEIDRSLPQIKQYFNQTYVLGIQPPHLDAAKAMTLKVVFSRDGMSSEGFKEILVPASPPPPPPVEEPEPESFLKRYRWWFFGGLGLVLALCVVGVVLMRKRARAKAVLEGEQEGSSLLSMDEAGGASGILDGMPTTTGRGYSTAPPEMPQVAQGRLVVLESGIGDTLPPGTAFDVYERTQLGRADDCMIQIPDSHVSRHHCDITASRGVFTLTNFRSRNGTFLNGEQVETETRLRHGDVITIGQVKLQFSELA